MLEAAAHARPSLYGPELAVALVALGRTAAAERVLTLASNSWPAVDAGSIAVVRAGAGPRRGPRRRRALRPRRRASADRAGLPVEAAETRLAHAEHLHRATAGATTPASSPSRPATSFDRWGVRGWDARVARLIDGASGSGADAVASELTSAEYRVALAVANGATNREAAATLFLSVKTVDFHLQNIYRKLGLRSRTELAVRLRVPAARPIG